MKRNVLKKTSWVIVSILTLLLFTQPTDAATADSRTIKNGQEWFDTSGNLIQAHGGGFMKYGAYYYWVGEDKLTNSARFNGVNLYRSKDLKNWEFVHQILSMSANPNLTGKTVERPKLIYNEKTKMFVLWAHWENGENYSSSHLLVATSQAIGGDYKVIRNFRPGAGEVADPGVDPTYTGTDGNYGYGSRDFTVYNDTSNHAAYLISTQNSSVMRVYKLTDDYTNVDWKNSYPLFAGKKREAPALVKVGDYYFLFTSSQSGWYPNQAMVSFTKDISDPNGWSDMQPVGNNSTFYSQPTNIMEISRPNGENQYIYMGDRWNPSKLGSSQYIWLPLTFKGTNVTMNYVSTWQLTHTGKIKTSKDKLLSENKPVTGSEAKAGFSLNQANDGNYVQELGSWNPSSAYMPVNVPFEWQVDLQKNKKLSRIDISFVSYNGSETYAQFQIYGSNDRSQWTLLKDESQNKTTSFISDDISGTYRYVKIAVSRVVNAHNGNAASWAAGFTEVQVYGK
ncbi:family 43 glycosylhydrolase [Sporolactobacillus shoreicorticis]|uniref:Family 43 glycosylhydrolase n=1 Tax=Sporolactobacillus shoreicorticis TaxID=1923877 RepID=A0ABW5S910_9BACL|nr:family 43 glycosylhydrolase [Sporolactobacillus shoreicorticis]MCO7127900.1 family 43 glycosylhydrolase [Sporolactobacillus shoreicorticis]